MKDQLNMILSSPKLWSEFFLPLNEGNYYKVYNWIHLVMRWKDAGSDKTKHHNSTKKRKEVWGHYNRSNKHKAI